MFLHHGVKYLCLVAVCVLAISGVTHAADRVTTIAGTGNTGSAGDGGPAIDAEFFKPVGVTIDVAGNIFVADLLNNKIRKIDTAGIISTVVGTGDLGDLGDGGPATAAQLSSPHNVAFDGAGNMFIADASNNKIRKVDTLGDISTVAGTGIADYSGDGDLAINATLNSPRDLAFSPAGELYIADYDNHVIRKIAADGLITTVAGSGSPGFSGDGDLAIDAELNHPRGVTVDSEGHLHIADRDNHVIRMIDGAGMITTIAGNATDGFSGDEEPATDAQLSTPSDIAFDLFGNMLIADGTNRVRRVDSEGTITTLAGTGDASSMGDGGPAELASFNGVKSIAVNTAGSSLIAEFGDKIRKIAFSPTITSPLDVTADVGFPFDYEITAVGESPISFDAIDLPDGLTMVGAVISGTPTEAGVFNATLEASNDIGTATETLAITIAGDVAVSGTDPGSPETGGCQLIRNQLP